MTVDGLTTERRGTVETFIADWLTQHRIPGVALALVVGGGDSHRDATARVAELALARVRVD